MAVEKSPIEWALTPLKRYAEFSGRAPRAEYWWFMLASTLANFLFEMLDGLLGGPIVGFYGPTSLIVTLALIVPGLSVLVRRLHDIGRSGWWALLNLTSYVFVAIGFTTTDPARLFDPIQELGMGTMLAFAIAFLISAVVLLVFAVTRGDEGPNRYGDDPYGSGKLEEIFA